MGEFLLDAAVRRRLPAKMPGFHAGQPPSPPPCHAVERAHEGVPLIVIQRQLGHSNLGNTSI